MTLEMEAPRRKQGRLTEAEREARLERLQITQPRRWQLSDLDEWLLKRLNYRWEAAEATWRGKLAGFSAGNEFLFITNGQAVLLAMSQRHVMSGKPIVMEVFAYARSADFRNGVWGLEQGAELGETALRQLYRQMREWAKSMDAVRAYVGISSDMVPSSLKDMLGGYYVVGGAP